MEPADHDAVAHELRTAACVVSGLLELLLAPRAEALARGDRELSLDELRMLAAVERNAERICAVTRALRGGSGAGAAPL